jgi:hypothetical protein
MAKRPLDLKKLPSNNRITVEDPPFDTKMEVRVRTKGKPKSGLAADVRDISSYLYEDVILPAVKSAITEFVTNGIDMIIWGTGGSPNRRARGGRTNYNRAYSPRERTNTRTPRYRSTRDSMEIDEISFVHRQEAERTLAHLLELIAKYGWATVGDLYQVVGWTSNHNHERYGWSGLRDVRIIHTSDGYLIDLPEPEYRD